MSMNTSLDPRGGERNSHGMSEAKLIERLKSCQTIAVKHAREHFPRFINALEENLAELAEEARSNQEQARLYETLREYRDNRAELERYFCGYLGEGYIKFKNKDLQTETGEEKFRGDMLSLVDNEDLEETIAISSITHRADNHFAEPLWALNQRLSVLNGGDKVNDKGNPISPVQFCESLRKALKLLSVDTKAKIIAYRVLDREFIPTLKELLDETNNLLINEGILPNLHYSPGVAGQSIGSALEQYQSEFDSGALETAPPRPAPLPGSGTLAGIPGMAMPDPSLPSDQYQGNLVDAIRMLQGHIAQYGPGGAPAGGVAGGGVAPTPASPGGAAGGRPVMFYSNQQLVGALQNLQTQALAVTGQLPEGGEGQIVSLTPNNFAAVGAQLQEELEEEGEVDPGDMHTIDLVGMLFEYMLSDDNLPSAVKALLSYLHTPFLKIAFIDKDFFEQTDHPARLLLNSLAESGARWVSNDGSSQYEIYPKIKNIVSQVLEEFENDVRLFAELLLEFSAYTKKIARRQELMERRAMEKVQGEEKLREVKIRVNQEVRSRTDNRELPSAVLLLLLQPWSDYLAFLLLRYGDQSESWQRSVGAIDDLLWSIEPKESNVDKARQMEMHDELLDILETGFETIGYDQAKGKKLLEALVSLQKLALQSKKVEPAPAPMRDRLESMAAEKVGHFAANEDQPTPEEAKMVENLKMIEFGTWFEFEGGKRLKVAWYNSKTLHYMLVDQMGKKVAMKSGLELAREMLGGTAKVIAGSTKPFFERALENIFHNLNAKAEAIQPGESDA